MSPSDNKSKDGSSGKLNNAYLVIGIIVGVIAILGFLGIPNISGLFPAPTQPTAQVVARTSTPLSDPTTAALAPTLASSTKTPSAIAASQTAAATSLPPAFTDTLQPKPTSTTVGTDTSTTRAVGDELMIVGKSYTGTLAKDEHQERKFTGNANTPLLFTFQRTADDGNLNYIVEILDANGIIVRPNQGTLGGGTVKIPFTPNADGTYMLRISATGGYGPYAVVLSLIAGPASSRNQIQPLEPNKGGTGTLGVGAFDTFSFQGNANTPLHFTFQRTADEGNLNYIVEILDANGIIVYPNQGTLGGSTANIFFTPNADGTYMLRISATGGYGPYAVVLSK